MENKTISPENKLQEILDFDVCKQLVDKAVKNNEGAATLCPHYSINVQSRFEDGEQLQWDLDELSDYIGHYVEVSDYDDLIVYFNESEDFDTEN